MEKKGKQWGMGEDSQSKKRKKGFDGNPATATARKKRGFRESEEGLQVEGPRDNTGGLAKRGASKVRTKKIIP